METMSANLQPYKTEIGAVATAATIAHIFSGCLVVKKIMKQECTHRISSTPFIGGLILAILLLQYATMLNDSPMFRVNVVAVVMNSIYSFLYYVYSEEKWGEVYKPLVTGVALLGAMLTYVTWEDPKTVAFRYACMLTIYSLVLMGSPLLQLKDIMAEKDASQIQYSMVLIGTLVNFIWLIYGIVLLDTFTIVHHAIGFLLSLAQLALSIKYVVPKCEDDYEDVLEFLRRKYE